MARGMILIGCLVIVVALLRGEAASIAEEWYTSPVYIVIGGSLGWTVPSNTSYYSEWVNTTTFQLGQHVIVFNATNGTQNLAQVSKAEYDNCRKTAPSENFTGIIETGMSPGFNYYLSAEGDHCERGQKVAFYANGTIESTSSASSPSVSAFFALLSTTVIYFLTYL